MGKFLIITPLHEERRELEQAFRSRGYASQAAQIGRVPVSCAPDLDCTLAKGGLGKVQCAVITQHLIDSGPAWDGVLCVGGAGSLAQTLAPGDVVVGTACVEHDFRRAFRTRRLPTYAAAPDLLAALRTIPTSSLPYALHFGPIASGDEDVHEPSRRQAIHNATEALAVAWEGIGGARACAFNKMPFLEIRGITDTASGDVPSAFKANLRTAMTHVADLLLRLTHSFSR